MDKLRHGAGVVGREICPDEENRAGLSRVEEMERGSGEGGQGAGSTI